ncbi:hypothetical protein ABZ208_29245 [Streptomyces sp. NPDC006208]|uniref:hypothetical protein n=1 Tax=Streptomyces sp. NPDC006208 TaxID=3156734 RepID=UPI00339DF931
MRKLVRTSAAAAGLLAALALTGCGSDAGGGNGTPKASASPGESGDNGSGGGESASLEGAWTGMADGGPVALSVSGTAASIVADGHACTGQVKDMGGEPMLSLKCADGNTDRTMGAIESNDGKTLVISWDAGKKDTLKKADPGKLPELPTDLPTDLPTG